MVENFSSTSKDLFFGKAGDLTGDGREHAEVSAPWLTPVDRRGLFWTHLKLDAVSSGQPE
ncbi:hypothetical protein [Nonomuraea guangzhouensis]|uniref:Uncharacterized protein n=1 Tax=Nonomuraea guangzhouensis TaxID=1291555 RepID=A0ABW4GE44_9ACTN|nr:hypothetical protein [Nonomuraea guangzhouensis]